MTHRILAPTGVLAILAFAPAAAPQAPKPDVLKRPARERCKRHYARPNGSYAPSVSEQKPLYF